MTRQLGTAANNRLQTYFNPIEVLPEDIHERYEEFSSYADTDVEFPRTCLPLEDELNNNNRLEEHSVHLYTMFVYFLLLGSKRTRLKVANAFKKPGTPDIPGDTKSEKNRALLRQAGYIETANHPFYLDIQRWASMYQWQRRAHDWDTYLAKKTLTRIANVVTEVGMEALGVLRNEMLTSKNPYVRMNSAKALLDKAIPTVTQSKTTNVEVRIGLNSDDAVLYELLGTDTQKALSDRDQFLNSLPQLPQVKRIDEDGIIDGEVRESNELNTESRATNTIVPPHTVIPTSGVPSVSQEEIDKLAANIANDFPDSGIEEYGHS